MGLSKLFVLTTRSIHWFRERGFTPVDIDSLPESKKEMYNYQRRSKVLMADWDNNHPLLSERVITRTDSKIALNPLLRSVRVAIACPSTRSSAYSDRRWRARVTAV